MFIIFTIKKDKENVEKLNKNKHKLQYFFRLLACVKSWRGRPCFSNTSFFSAANPSAAAVDLMGVVRNLVFTTTVPVLLGDHILPQTQQGMKHFQNQFVQFDNSFEHGAKLPEFLLKEWAKSKHFLLGPFHEVIHKKSGTNLKEDTLLQAMVDLLDGDCAPNYATVLFWASLANAVPITFWTLAFVLSDQSIKEAVQKEVDELLGPYIDRGE